MIKILQPNFFEKYSTKLLPWAVGGTIIFLITGLYSAFNSPPDYQQSDAVRIMYVHVPSAWMSLLIYSFIAGMSTISLVWRISLCDFLAKSAAPIGAGFTFITLVTGSIWGKPMWGTWWVWDARLTSVLILFFLYLGYMALQEAYHSRERASKTCAILAIVGFINIPIIKFSVDWWNTLHQPASIIKIGGPAIHSSMLIPLFLMFFAFMGYFISLLIIKTKTEIYTIKLDIR